AEKAGAGEAHAAFVELDEVIQESLEGVERAARIVQEVAALSHGGGGERRPADVNEAIDQALRVATLGVPPQIRIQRKSAQIPEVMGSPEHLKQLFLNLILNAMQAVAAGGRVGVETLREGESVVAVVSDDGCGIAPDDVARIFDPFFTTRGAGEGTG